MNSPRKKAIVRLMALGMVVTTLVTSMSLSALALQDMEMYRSQWYPYYRLLLYLP